MAKNYTAKDFMTSKVITLNPDTNIFDAIDIFIKNRISGAPVVDKDNNLIGILSEKDCLRLMVENQQHSGYGEVVSDFLTKTVITISPETDLFTVAEIFIKNNLKRLPVVKNNLVLGQISRRDILIAINKIGKERVKKLTPLHHDRTDTENKSTTTESLESKTRKLKQAIKYVKAWSQSVRPLDTKGNPGSLMIFPKSETREFIVIGDIHANLNNFDAIVEDSVIKTKLKNNKLVIVFLGDLVHDDRPGQITEMVSSVEIIEKLFDLMGKYPNNVIYLLGNHDTFSSKLMKNRILQGKLFQETMDTMRGSDYTKLVQSFFDSLPLCLIHPYFIAIHAGPVRGGITKKELINVRYNENHLFQLTWNRVNEYNATPSDREYGPTDLITFRKNLNCPEDTPVIVGHNPLSDVNNGDSVWENKLDCQHHVIIYSNWINTCPYLSFTNSINYKLKHAELTNQSESVIDYFNRSR